MSRFTIYPAIDLRIGRVVRLSQGDPGRQTIYGNDPAATARHWLDAGAAWLHVVNLDGAFGDRDTENHAALLAILDEAAAYQANIQFGGGLHSLDEVERTLALGVKRVVLGTAAIQNPEMVEQAISKFGREQIAIAMDVRHGRVKISGWLEDSGVAPLSLARQLITLGAATIIYTNIERDGVGGGSDVEAARLVAELGLDVIASGGIHNIDDVRAVHSAGLHGVIIGRALYEGQVSLVEALQCWQNE